MNCGIGFSRKYPPLWTSVKKAWTLRDFAEEIKRKAMEKAWIIDNSVPKYKPSNDILEFLSKF